MDLKKWAEWFSFPMVFRWQYLFLAVWVLMLSFLGIALIGNLAPEYQTRQALGVGIGCMAMVCFAFWDYRKLTALGWFLYLAAMTGLGMVNVMGAVSGGAARWLELGSFRFQPSEPAKLILIVFFSWMLDRNQERMNHMGFLVFLAALMGVPVISILRQPDLSTSIVLLWIFLWLLFLAGLDRKIIGRCLVMGIPCAMMFFYLVTRPGQTILNDYQYRRIMSWLQPGAWIEESYQQRNSVQAIGLGGLWGLGIESQDPVSVINSGFLPEPHTDFIMAAAGEKLGFAGCAGIILLLAVISLQCLWIGAKSRDLKGRLICEGVAVWIGGQAFVNLGVVSGMLPNTGLTLPFVSYGLSSLVSLYMAIGVVLNVGMQNPRKGDAAY